MSRFPRLAAILAHVALLAALGRNASAAGPACRITIAYPLEGTVFPPEITPPTFLWREAPDRTTNWRITVRFADGAPPIKVTTRGARPSAGAIDPRCVAPTNELPEPPGGHSWRPEAGVWEAIKRHSRGAPAVVTITGQGPGGIEQSHAEVRIETSRDPVRAPIFYRDVPLMPEEPLKGTIRPLPQNALPLIAWRVRSVADARSRVVLTGMPTCANCHSFSADGKTLAMDLDGPQNDKGLYAIAPTAARMSIRNRDVIQWSAFRDGATADSRVGFMSQVSPDGEYVITTVNRTDYVANFKDYRFLQVFYPTRGMLAWYRRRTGEMRLLPGADDPRYVHTGAAWSPDGQSLVFSRAEARDAYPPGAPLAAFANDPREVQIRYDLYRIPFNGGRGGRAEPVAGASANGKSNSFPRISPDGRWIVYVQAANGQLMRPDSELYMVPVKGGTPRRMLCNTRRMNSWHSFSPNGRWMVFSSKSESPYTEMFLTHIDERGMDSPPVRVENAKPANRAVNLPEFVNLAADGLRQIEVPAVDVYRAFNEGIAATSRGRYEDAIAAWGRVLKATPGDYRAETNLGLTLSQMGRFGEAAAHLRRAVELNPEYAAGHNNLALALESSGNLEGAIQHWQAAAALSPQSVAIRNNLAAVLQSRGRTAEALAEWRAAIRIDPDNLQALKNASWALSTSTEPTVRNGAEAVELAERAARLSGGVDGAVLDSLAAAYAEARRFGEAVETARRALAIASQSGDSQKPEASKRRLDLYQRGYPYRESRLGK